MRPLAPTNAPPMSNDVLSNTKPARPAAQPVNELSSEMTTGMSAPPIGDTAEMPSTSDRIISVMNAAGVTKPKNRIIAASASVNAANNRFTVEWPLNVSGRPGKSSCSLP